MKGLVTPFKVGLVILAAAAAFAYMFGSVSQSIFKGVEGYRVHAILADATGLATRTRVMMAGIPIGEVEAVVLDGARARVQMLVRADVRLHRGEVETLPDGRQLLRDGATLTKRQASLLGDYYLELTPGLRGPLLVDGDEILLVVTPPGMEQIVERMDAVAENVERITRDVLEVTQSLATVLGGDEGAARLDQMIADVAEVMATVNALARENQQAVGNIVNNAEAISADLRRLSRSGSMNVDAILADVAAMTTELRFLVAQSSGDFSEGVGALMGTLASLQLALDNLNYALENVQVISDRIVDGEGTLGQFVNDPAIADEAREILASARELIGGFTNTETWLELRSEYGANERAFKNYLGLSLRPRPDKYYLFEFVDDPRGRTEVTRRIRFTSDPNESPAVLEEESTTTESFKFTLVLGRRWEILDGGRLYLGGRFGLIESTGGFGMNAWILNEGLEMRADIFDFGSSDFARVKLYALLNLSSLFPNSAIARHLFVQAGVDDVLNPGPRDFFFGAGLIFLDRDLRTVMLAAPSP